MDGVSRDVGGNGGSVVTGMFQSRDQTILGDLEIWPPSRMHRTMRPGSYAMDQRIHGWDSIITVGIKALE